LLFAGLVMILFFGSNLQAQNKIQKKDLFEGKNKSISSNERVSTGNNVETNTNQIKEEAPECSKYGDDSTMTLDMASIYTEFYKQKNYVDAIDPWRYVYYHAPGYHEAVMINGIKMYEYFIKNSTDSIEKERFFDTLVMIYRKRIECFGKDAFNKGRLGYKMMKYRPKDYDIIRNLFQQSIEEGKEKTEYFILYPYIRLEGFQFKRGNRDTLGMLAIYETVIKICETNIENGKNAEKYQQAMESIIDELDKLGVLNCDNLKPYFTKKYLKSPQEEKIWKDAYRMLSTCKTCDPTYQEMWKKLFEIEPSAKLATKIAVCESKIGDANIAISYFDKAIELEENMEQKAKLAYSVALIVYKEMRNFPKSRDYCYKAIKYNPNWGEPYLLIGTLYASSGKQCDPSGKGVGWDAQVVVWPAIDKWKKAKQVDPSVAGEANKKIIQYSQYFPDKGEAFMKGYSEGDPFTVKCWINEQTKMRFK
jgi:tetratricopeptide (TPR) repeat protein